MSVSILGGSSWCSFPVPPPPHLTPCPPTVTRGKHRLDSPRWVCLAAGTWKWGQALGWVRTPPPRPLPRPGRLFRCPRGLIFCLWFFITASLEGHGEEGDRQARADRKPVLRDAKCHVASKSSPAGSERDVGQSPDGGEKPKCHHAFNIHTGRGDPEGLRGQPEAPPATGQLSLRDLAGEGGGFAGGRPGGLSFTVRGGDAAGPDRPAPQPAGERPGRKSKRRPSPDKSESLPQPGAPFSLFHLRHEDAITQLRQGPLPPQRAA